jgi:dephospho-CoA kinase
VKTYGITGGIGMGKSTVATLLTRRGIPVVDTDDLARQVVQLGQPAVEEVKREFGPAIFNASGELNREALAGVVFGDAVARKKLEAILHPRIQQLWQIQLAIWRNEGCKQACVIIPLLFETRAESEFDLVVCIASSAVTQRQRLSSRGWTAGQIEQRIAAQMPTAEKMARAHRVIWSEGHLDVLMRQCDLILSPALDGKRHAERR